MWAYRSSWIMKSEEQELNYGLQKALAARDGWLVHWYGSQIMHRNALRDKIEKDREEWKRRTEELLEKCKLKAEELYEKESLRSRKAERRRCWLY
jgi:hypothetical protein